MENVVGTAGHIDHGKTALIRALTGIDADRLPEEKRRGITIDLGFAEATIADVHFGFVDVPGHERFVKNMLAGASGIDVVLLVVAANEGVMPQTREHFDICRLLGIKRGVIALTKADLVDAEALELARLDVTELVAGSFLEGAPIIPVSSATGEGVDELRHALTLAASGSDKNSDGLAARLPIDRSFSMKGFGAVVTGTLVAGSIAEGDEMELLPGGLRARVRGLQTHGRAVKSVASGNRVAVNLAGVDHAEVERGMMLASPGVFQTTQTIDAKVDVLQDAARPLRSRQRVRFHIGTVEALARIQVLTPSGEIRPGADGYIQVRLESPVVAVIGDRFILRSYSPQVTIAGGVVLDPFATRHRRRELAEINDRLDTIAKADDNESVVSILLDHGAEAGITPAKVSARLGCEMKQSEFLFQKLGAVAAGDRYLRSAALDALAARAHHAIEAFQKSEPLAKGMPRELLREKVFAASTDDVFRAVISKLEHAGKITADREALRTVGDRPELGEREAAFVDGLNNALVAARLDVPKFADAFDDACTRSGVATIDAQKLVRLMLDSRDVIKVSDDFYFAAVAIDDLVSKLRVFADGSADRLIDVAAFKSLAGVSRKYAIPLLEYFDREKITVRAGEKRLIL